MDKGIKVKNMLKKIICLNIIFMMLLGNFITPVTIFAEELNSAQTQEIEALNDESETKTGTSGVDGESEETPGNGGEDSTGSSEESGLTGDSEQGDNNGENADVSDEEGSGVEGSDKKEGSDVQNGEKPSSETNNDKKAKSSSNADLDDNGSQKINLDELKERIKPAKKDGIIEKEKNDDYEIEEFGIQFVSGATKDENNNLVWTPDNSSAGHEFSFRVNYAISGKYELPAEAIQITIPKQILRNKEKNFDDKYIMSLPKMEEYDGTTEFAYIENEDCIIVFNPKQVKAGINGYFEIAYATNSTTFNYKDYDTKNLDTVASGGTASDPFNAVITVKAGEEDTLAKVSNEEKVYIDTKAKIISTQKRYPTLYREWNTSWMENTPEHSDEYYYLVWEIKTYIQNNTTQKYNFTLDDVVEDLTEGTDGSDYELVGYKLSGEKYYSKENNTQENATRDEYRYDYVLTRHKIDTYEDKVYTLKNTIKATVDPVDQVDEDTSATSSNTFSWDPAFVPPTGHFELFKYGNNNWYSKFGTYWDYANYDLDKLQKEETDELKGFKYFTETIGYAYPWTLKDEGDSDNPEDYGVNAVKYETWDDKLYLEDDETPMNTDDYYLEYLTYSITNQDAEHDEFENKFKPISPTYESDEKITFYGKFSDESDWVAIGTYNLKTGETSPISDYVESMTSEKIIFKEGVHCTGWKFETENKHYYTYITVTPYFVITSSDYINGKIQGKDSIKIKNNVSTNITDHNGKTIFEKETSAVDYARVTYYDSEITKKVSSVSNNVVNKTYTVTWKVNAWEKATSGSGKAEYIRQDSGKFYDLIPLGGEVDVDSIQIQTEEGFLEENEYTYEVITNYNNSGRTMLIINIDVQAQYYTVYYKTIHSWDSIKDYGKNVLNPVAYETGNEKISNGYPDDGGKLSSENKDLFKDLDNTTDNEKFIYTEQTYNINAVTASVSGLYKKVKNSKESEYSYYTEVQPNGKYSYQLRYQNSYINKSKNLVLFDSLENFVIKNTESGETKTSGWKGTLQSINVTQLERKGIKPVIYISTMDNLDLEEHNDITDESIWKEVKTFTDLSKAKAIAIDMRKDKWGNDYVLDTGDSVTAVLHMEAPEEVTHEIEENPYTYNNIYIKNTLIDELEGTSEYFIHQDYTTVKYHVVADVPFRKVSSDDKDYGIKGITFRLYGTSNYGTEVDEYVTSNKDGLVNFKDIEAGEYILQEYEATPDWVEDHTEHRVVITNDAKVKIDDEQTTKVVPIRIENTPRIHTDVTFTKRNLVNNFPIEGAKFKLEGTSNYGNEILMYVTSDSNGEVKIENLEYGTYELNEIEVPDGYILNKDKYRVVVDENGNYDIQKGIEKEATKKYSHTPNIDDTGYATGNYANNLELTNTVTIEGAKSLNVLVYYSTESITYDWVCVYDNTVIPNSSNYNSSKTGKLGGGSKQYSAVNSQGYETACSKKEITIEGDTVQFYFRSDRSGTYYGYYAIVEAVGMDNTKYESIYTNGTYNIYNEPLHNFRLVKLDSYSQKTIEGAEFRLNGISDYGNSYDKQIKSNAMGFVDFEELEPGMYILQETYAPEITDENGSIVTYVLDESKHVVTVAKNGDVTIDGLEKNKNGNFEFYNERYKGQITIVKKWIDDENNDTRKEPVVHISTEKPKESRFQYFRDNHYSSSSYDGPLYYIDSDYKNKITGSFKRNTDYTEEEVIQLEAKRIDIDYDDENAKYKIYGWIDKDGNCWWWSNAEVALMTNKSNKMFYGMNKVTSIDVTDIDTSEVTSMREMFRGCSNLEHLDISGWDTSKVTDMSRMFYSCSKLISLDIGQLNTGKVTNMVSMFAYCSKLANLDISKWDTSKVTDMSYMFYWCCNLEILDISEWDTSKVTDMSYMFLECHNLKELNISKWDTSKVTDMNSMFSWCNNLKELNISKWDTSKVTDMSYMFYDCYNLTKLNLSGCGSDSLTNMSGMFNYCNSLTELNLSGFNAGNIQDLKSVLSSGGFSGSLTKLDLSNFNASNVTDMSYMFSSYSNLQELDLSGFNASKVTNMSEMFSFCYNLKKLNLSNFNMGKVTDMYRMFFCCNNLKELDLSSFNTSNVTNMSYMFCGDNNLETIYVSENFKTNQVTDSSAMFASCTNIRGGNGTTYDSSKMDKTYACIDKVNQKGYFTDIASKKKSINNTSKIPSIRITDVMEKKLEETRISKTGTLENKHLLAPITGNTDDGQDEDSKADEDKKIVYSTADENLDDQGNEINWVKNGDTWTYTFYVDDPDATWYVWEDSLDGYSSNYTAYYPGIVQNREATIINSKADSTPQSNYDIPTVAFGSLAISKTLMGVYDDGTKEITDDNTEFTFNVKLTADSSHKSYIEGIKILGDVIFKDGFGTVKVRAGETVIIPDIPIGTSYEVTEETLPEYQVDGHDKFSGKTGTISNETTIINVTNYTDKRTSTIPSEEEKTTSFTITKKVTGNYEIEQDYNFEISLSNLKENTTYNLSNGASFTSDSTGCANVSFSLKNGEELTVQNIPVGSKYKVYEHAGDYISSYVITDSNNNGSINNSANNNTKTNKELSTATETADEGEDITITFTNKRTVTQNLKLTKTVTDENDDNSYIFKIEFSNMSNGTSFNSSFGKVTADSTGKAEATLYLAGGDEAEIYDIPVGTKYTVTELASSSIASYKVTDENGMDKIVSASGANTQSKMALSTAEETVNEGENVTVSFINDTVNQEPDSVTASLGVTKDVVNVAGEKLENCEDTFTFELTPDNETNPMPENSSITITGNGDASFGTITFTETGTYSYKITEKAGDLEQYAYDDSVYTIVYDVTNTEGLLDLTKTVKKNGFNSDAIVFTNRDIRADVRASKIDEEGNSLSGATLQILDSEKNVVKEWTTGEDEEDDVANEDIYTFKLLPGTYTLHEVQAPEGYELADDIIFIVNEDGTISVNDEVVDAVIMVDTKIKVEQIEPEEDNEDNYNNDEISDEQNDNSENEPNKLEGESPRTGDKIAIYGVIFILAGVLLSITVKKKFDK